MERQRLQDMAIGELQEEARKYGLNPPSDTSRCIDMIMSHLERQATSDLQKGETRAADKSKAMQSTVAATTPTGSSDLSQICAWMAEQMRFQQQQMRFQQEQMRFQQEQMRLQQEQMFIQQENQQEQQRQNQAMMQQMIELMNSSREDSQNRMRNVSSEDNVIRANSDISITRRQPISSIATAHP